LICRRDYSRNPVLPFFHLQSDGFWHLVPVPDKEEVLESIPQTRSLGALHELVLGATLDEDRYETLSVEAARDGLDGWDRG
jgi:putative restriction endonuclease